MNQTDKESNVNGAYVGGVVSTTLTLNVQERSEQCTSGVNQRPTKKCKQSDSILFPAVSYVMQVTGVEPRLNVLPLAGVQLVRTIFPASYGVTVKETGADGELPWVGALTLTGQVRVGRTVSTTVTWKTHIVLQATENAGQCFNLEVR